MSNISKKTLAKIEKENIKPTPKWHFLIKNDILWLAAAISGLIGALSMSIIIHEAINRDWFLYQSHHAPTTPNLILDLPLIWFGLLIVTVLIAYYNIEHSKAGYRYHPLLVILASIFFSIIFGTAFCFAGFGARIDCALGNKIPMYRSVENRAKELWAPDQDGRLGGEFVKKEDGALNVRDLNGKNWHVDVSHLNNPGPLPLPGQRVKIVGDKTSNDTFQAEDIRPWQTPMVKCF